MRQNLTYPLVIYVEHGKPVYLLSCTGQTHYIFYYILVCNFLTILLVINILSFANVDYFPYLYKIY